MKPFPLIDGLTEYSSSQPHLKADPRRGGEPGMFAESGRPGSGRSLLARQFVIVHLLRYRGMAVRACVKQT